MYSAFDVAEVGLPQEEEPAASEAGGGGTA